MTDARLAEVAHEDRSAFLLRYDRIRDVVEALHQAHASDIEALRSHRQVIAADVRVALGQRIHDLIERHVVAEEPPRIEIDMEFLGGAPERRHVDDAGHALELSADLPLLNRLQVRQALPWSFDFITVDLCDRGPG